MNKLCNKTGSEKLKQPPSTIVTSSKLLQSSTLLPKNPSPLAVAILKEQTIASKPPVSSINVPDSSIAPDLAKDVSETQTIASKPQVTTNINVQDTSIQSDLPKVVSQTPIIESKQTSSSEEMKEEKIQGKVTILSTSDPPAFTTFSDVSSPEVQKLVDKIAFDNQLAQEESASLKPPPAVPNVQLAEEEETDEDSNNSSDTNEFNNQFIPIIAEKALSKNPKYNFIDTTEEWSIVNWAKKNCFRRMKFIDNDNVMEAAIECINDHLKYNVKEASKKMSNILNVIKETVTSRRSYFAKKLTNALQSK
jgi:hypothetical protein